MIITEQIRITKQLPFDANHIEKEFADKGLDVLRWAVVEVTESEYIIDAAILK